MANSPDSPSAEPKDLQKEPTPTPTPASLMSIHSVVVGGLCIVAAGLLIGLVIQTRKLKSRDEMLANGVNRAAQVQAGLVQLQAEISEDKADADRLQQKFNESTERLAEMAAASDKLTAEAAATQKLLIETRAAGAKFQTEMAAAKVASLEQKGIAEVALAKVDVLQVQLKHATGVSGQFEEDLASSQAEIAALQKDLAKAETLIATLRSPTAKR